MTTAKLTVLLAERVMGWKNAPGRFLMGKRRWIPQWRFQPLEKLDDAFRLLEEAGPQQYLMGSDETGTFWARVRIGEATGEARHRSKARAITHAVALAIGIELEK
jgi:hypothetical protein